MSEDGKNGAIDPARQADIDKLIDDTAAAATRPVSPLRTQREISWQRFAKPAREPAPCARCDRPTLMSVDGVCRPCFIDGVPARDPDVPPIGLTPHQVAARCVLCARVPPVNPENVEPTVYFQPSETLIRGQLGVVCSSCAFSAAGCAGAKNADDARRMMATTATQAQATRDCDVCLRIAEKLEEKMLAKANAGDMLPEDSLGQLMTLSEAAETFARIARGDR